MSSWSGTGFLHGAFLLGARASSARKGYTQLQCCKIEEFWSFCHGFPVRPKFTRPLHNLALDTQVVHMTIVKRRTWFEHDFKEVLDIFGWI